MNSPLLPWSDGSSSLVRHICCCHARHSLASHMLHLLLWHEARAKWESSERAVADAAAGVVHAPKRNPDADDDNQYMPEHIRHSVRRSAEGNSSADEDSDFE